MSVGNIGGGVLVAPYGYDGPMTARSWLMLGKARDLRFTSIEEQRDHEAALVAEQQQTVSSQHLSEASAPAGDEGADH